MRHDLTVEFEAFLDRNEALVIRKKIEYLETLADVYADRDRVRLDSILVELRANEMKLLDLMTSENIIC